MTNVTPLYNNVPQSPPPALRIAQSLCGCSSTVSTPMALDGSLTERRSRSRSSQTLCVLKPNPFAAFTPRLPPHQPIPQPPYTTRVYTTERTPQPTTTSHSSESVHALAQTVPAVPVRWAISESYVDMVCRYCLHKAQINACKAEYGDEKTEETHKARGEEESDDLVHTPRELPVYTTGMMSEVCRQAAHRVLQPLVTAFFATAKDDAAAEGKDDEAADTQMQPVCSVLLARVMDTRGEAAGQAGDAERVHKTHTTNEANDEENDEEGSSEPPVRRCDKLLVEYTTREVGEEWAWGRLAALETHPACTSDPAPPVAAAQVLPNGLVTTPCALDRSDIASLNTTLTSTPHSPHYAAHTSLPSHDTFPLLMQDGAVEELYCHTRRRGVLLWLVHALFRRLLSCQVRARTACMTSKQSNKEEATRKEDEVCRDESLGLSMYVLLPSRTALSSSCSSSHLYTVSEEEQEDDGSGTSRVHCLLHPALAERQQLVTKALHVMTHRVPCPSAAHTHDATAEVTAIRIGTRSECLELMRAGLRSYYALCCRAVQANSRKKKRNDLAAAAAAMECGGCPAALPLYIVFHRYRGYTTTTTSTTSTTSGAPEKASAEELCWRYVSSLSVIDLAPLPACPHAQHTNLHANGEGEGEQLQQQEAVRGNQYILDTLTKLPLFMHAATPTASSSHFSDMSCAARAVRRDEAMQLLAAHVLGRHTVRPTHGKRRRQAYHTVLLGELVTPRHVHCSIAAAQEADTGHVLDSFRRLFTHSEDWLITPPVCTSSFTLPHCPTALSPTALAEPLVHSPLTRPPLPPPLSSSSSSSAALHNNNNNNNNHGTVGNAQVTPILVPPSPAHPHPTQQLKQLDEEPAPLSLTLLGSPTTADHADSGSEEEEEEDEVCVGERRHHVSAVSPLSRSSHSARGRPDIAAGHDVCGHSGSSTSSNASSGTTSISNGAGQADMNSGSKSSSGSASTTRSTSYASDASHLVRTLNRFVFPDAAMVQQTLSKQKQTHATSSSTSCSSSSSIASSPSKLHASTTHSTAVAHTPAPLLQPLIQQPQPPPPPPAAASHTAPSSVQAVSPFALSAQPSAAVHTLPASRLAEPLIAAVTTSSTESNEEDRARGRAVRLVPAHQQITRVTIESARAKPSSNIHPTMSVHPQPLQMTTSYVHSRPCETRCRTTTNAASSAAPRKAPASALLPSTTAHTFSTATSYSARNAELGMPYMAQSQTSMMEKRAPMTCNDAHEPRVLPYKTRPAWADKDDAVHSHNLVATNGSAMSTASMLQQGGQAGAGPEARRTHAVMPRNAPPKRPIAAATTMTTTSAAR